MLGLLWDGNWMGDIDQLSGSGALQKQLAEVAKAGDRAAKPPSEQTGLPPKKWQLTCLSPLPDPRLTSTVHRVQCLHPALTPMASCGDS